MILGYFKSSTSQIGLTVMGDAEFAESKVIANKIVNTVISQTNVVLHAFGGAGKSYTLRDIISQLVDCGVTVCATALTGKASLNLNVPSKGVCATTLHSWAGVGAVQKDTTASTLLGKITRDSRCVKRWLDTRVLIVDEVSMLGLSFLEKLDYIARQIRRKPLLPFGGITLIFSGDFMQLPPIQDEFCFKSEIWNELNLEPFTLLEPKRFDDLEWFHILSRIRIGKHTSEDMIELQKRVDAYEEWAKNESFLPIDVVKPTIVYSKKVNTDSYNESELEEIKSKAVTFLAQDTFKSRHSSAKAEYYLAKLDDPIAKAIRLKVGAQVMLKCNLDIKRELVNGSRGVVTEISEEAKLVTVKFSHGVIERIGYYAWTFEDKQGIATRSQIPLILAYALTIHALQGATLTYAICCIDQELWEYGQAYVSLSRVKNRKGLYLSNLYPPCIKANPDALAYTQLLDKIISDRDHAQEDIELNSKLIEWIDNKIKEHGSYQVELI